MFTKKSNLDSYKACLNGLEIYRTGLMELFPYNNQNREILEKAARNIEELKKIVSIEVEVSAANA